MENVMTNGFVELTNSELNRFDGGDINFDVGDINFDVNEFIDQCAKYGRSWWNFQEEKGAEVYDVFH